MKEDKSEITEITEITDISKLLTSVKSEEAASKSAQHSKVAPDIGNTVVDNITNYTGDDSSERDYRPIRQSHEYRSGCLGGIMYFVFIACISISLAVFAWMIASDVLALNKEPMTAVVNLPSDVFNTVTVDELDEDGNVIGSKRVTSANIPYVADLLKEAGIIHYKWAFEFFCKISNAEMKINPGEYEIKSTYDYRALIKAMQQGASTALTVMVTIPEGFTMQQIFDRLEESGVASAEDLFAAAAEATFEYSFLEGKETGDASRLEGYLFPDTYEFYVNMNPSSAIKKFLDAFNSKLSADMDKQLEGLGITLDQAVIIASMIEKEAANDSERQLIASVIYNRIAANMSLGIDSTILYIHQDHEGAPTATMLAEDSPYNTRIYTGLTPTPICSPGIASIRAALTPETSVYYYYALDTESGLHRFFRNLNEFNAFVATQNYG